MASRSYGRVLFSLIFFGWNLTCVIYTVVKIVSYVDIIFRDPECWWTRQTPLYGVVDGEQAITSTKAQNLVVPEPCGFMSESPFPQDQPQKERQPQIAWMSSNRITKQEEKEEARAHLDLRSTMVVASSTSSPSVPVHAQAYRPSSSVMHPVNVFHFGYRNSGISYKLFRHFWRPKKFQTKSQRLENKHINTKHLEC